MKAYINDAIEGNTIPTIDGFFIYLMDDKKVEYEIALSVFKDKGIKGYIYSYARSILFEKVSKGRHSGTYIRLLEQMGNNPNEEQAQEVIGFTLD